MIQKKLILHLFILLLTLSFAAATVDFRLVPLSTTAAPGQTFQVEVRVDVPQSEAVRLLNFRVSPNVVSGSFTPAITAVTPGSFANNFPTETSNGPIANGGWSYGKSATTPSSGNNQLFATLTVCAGTWTGTACSPSGNGQLSIRFDNAEAKVTVLSPSIAALQNSPNINVQPSFSCTGTAPANANLCSGDDQGLTASTPITLVSACTSAKCEYTCATGRDFCISGTNTPRCVDFQTDSSNCGGCAVLCTSGQTCQSGQCRGTSPQCAGTTPNLCGTTCVNFQTDNNNCGTCARTCTSPQTCQSGVCGLRSLGSACTNNNECASGNCHQPNTGPRVCRCAVDSDCPSSRICNNNQCWDNNQPLGNPCFVDRQCASGTCSNSLCASAQTGPTTCADNQLIGSPATCTCSLPREILAGKCSTAIQQIRAELNDGANPTMSRLARIFRTLRCFFLNQDCS